MNAERKRVNELLRDHTMKAIAKILRGKNPEIRDYLEVKLALEASDEYALMADADREAREIETDPFR